MVTAASTPAAATRPADRYSASCRPDWKAEYVAWMTSVASFPCPGGACADVPPLEGSWPVRTPLITTDCRTLGRPRWVRLATSAVRSFPITTAPRIATPMTAPTSRLVLVVEAAMPERSGGTAASTEEVIGTTQVPMPMPVSARAPARGRDGGAGPPPGGAAGGAPPAGGAAGPAGPPAAT